jgi:hypothetical protein
MIAARWRAVDGDVRVPAEEAEWWGATLAVLVAVIHHPDVLAASQPETDPAEAAREALAAVDELQRAAQRAAGQVRSDGAGSRRCDASVHAESDEVVFSPGAEVAHLAFCVTVFATAVLDPESHEASIARGATAYAASAWSRDIGRASGAL